MAQELYELPQGWEWKTLKDSCLKITDGAHASPKSTDNGLPYVTVRDIDSNGFIDTQNCKKIRQEDFEKLIAGNCSPTEGSVLLSKDGTVGKVAVVNGYQQFVVLSSLAIITPTPEALSTYYLKYFLLSPRLQEYALKSKTGAAIKRIVLRNIAAFQIPVPPLAEQERIVAKLDALFSRIDQAIAQLQHTQAQTKALFASALDAVFEATTRNQPTSPLSEICTITSSKRIHKSDYVESGIPFFRTKEIVELGSGKNISSTLYISAEQFEKIDAKFGSPQKGDLLFSAVGTIGKMWIADGRTFYFKDGNLLWLKDYSDITPVYLKHTIRITLEQQIKDKSQGAAYKAISIQNLKSFQIPLPPIAEQSKIVAQLDAISERTQALTAATSAQLEKLQALKASLLDSAFCGQLPSDQ